jgi:hypothetical protein
MSSQISPPAIEDVDRISAISNPVARNLQITQCYHVLSRSFRTLHGPSANWCTFATWASRQAGQSIRKEDLVRTFEYQFRNSPGIGLAVKEIMKHASSRFSKDGLDSGTEKMLSALRPEEIFDRVSDAVARGNKKVFDEIGRIFADFLEKFQNDTSLDTRKISEFCAALQQGDPPDGQMLLREVFTAYYRARFTEDPKERDELVYYANLLTGCHEQTRLQPEIAEALNAAFQEREAIKKRIVKIIVPGSWLRLRNRIARLFGRDLILDRALNRFADQVQLIFRKVTTHYLMTLELANGEILRLGRDLEGTFPDSLSTIHQPELKELLQNVDPTPDSLVQSGARDWANFDERMHFITDFFRIYHHHQPLFNPPLSDAELNAPG